MESDSRLWQKPVLDGPDLMDNICVLMLAWLDDGLRNAAQPVWRAIRISTAVSFYVLDCKALNLVPWLMPFSWHAISHCSDTRLGEARKGLSILMFHVKGRWAYSANPAGKDVLGMTLNHRRNLWWWGCSRKTEILYNRKLNLGLFLGSVDSAVSQSRWRGKSRRLRPWVMPALC